MHPDVKILKPQVWFGVLFLPAGQGTAECPALPSWAEKVLDSGADDSDMLWHLALRGRLNDGAALTWICYATDSTVCYGLAVAESVQTAAGCTGEVSTCVPEEQLDGWTEDIALFLLILGLQTAKITWYQTLSL